MKRSAGGTLPGAMVLRPLLTRRNSRMLLLSLPRASVGDQAQAQGTSGLPADTCLLACSADARADRARIFRVRGVRAWSRWAATARKLAAPVAFPASGSFARLSQAVRAGSGSTPGGGASASTGDEDCIRAPACRLQLPEQAR